MDDAAMEEQTEFYRQMPVHYRIAVGSLGVAAAIVALVAFSDGELEWWERTFYLAIAAPFLALSRLTAEVHLEDAAVRIKLGWYDQEIPYADITAVAVGPDTGWGQIGRRRMDDGTTGYLAGGTSVRIQTGETSAVVSAKEPYRVVGTIQRRRKHTAGEHTADTEQTGR